MNLLKDADDVFAMTADHLRAIEALLRASGTPAPELLAKAQLLDPGGHDIADPIGAGIDVYRSSLAEIERALRERIAAFV